MKLTYIDLPPGETIECSGFIRSIAIATHPTLEDAEGIDCVTGKLVADPNSEQNIPTCSSSPLTEEDRASLEPLLVDLPKLHGRMSELEVDSFLYLYSSQPNRPTWEPVLNKKFDNYRIEYEQWDLRALHREKLQERLTGGKIQAFDADHLPEKQIKAGTYISRHHALGYLKECGISARQDGGQLKSENTAALTSAPNDEPLPTATKSVSHKDSQTRWTDNELEQVFNDHQTYKGQGKHNPTQLIAEKYGISTPRVRQLLRANAKSSPEKNYWNQLIR